MAVIASAFVLAAPASAAPTNYVTMSDGASIAINVKVPYFCYTNKCPTYFEMSGYESGSDEGKTPAGHLADQTGLPFPLQTGTREAHASYFDDRFVTVLASVRGTGCSSGEFDLFSQRSALDGKEVIDKWIAKQPWSNGDVAIFGHSYSGITGGMVASTRPERLRAVSISGLIGDLYRDVVYPGGVTNYGFPLLWTGAIRVAYDVGGGTLGGLYPVEASSPQCAANQAERRRNLLEDPLIHGLDDTDSNWYKSRSLVNMVDRINVPVHITSAYQDEQTGPRGPTYVFDKLSDSISKRLVLTNGVHGTNTEPYVMKDRAAWLDYWLRNKKKADLSMKTGTVDLATEFGPKTTPTTTSRVILGYQGGGKSVGDIRSNGFPLGQTQWTELYSSEGAKLQFDKDLATNEDRTWISGTKRQSYAYQAGVNTGGEVSSPTGPDEVELSTFPFQEPTAIAGPVMAKLSVSTLAPDTELFVQLLDRGPDGTLTYLNRGMLRTSHRQIDEAESQKTADGQIYRPYRPHEDREDTPPGQETEYLVDVFPVGHVFLPGHSLVVKVHAPPADDNDYNYIQKTLPGQHTLHLGPTKTRLTLPIVPMSAVSGYQAPTGQCPYASMRCLTP